MIYFLREQKERHLFERGREFHSLVRLSRHTKFQYIDAYFQIPFLRYRQDERGDERLPRNLWCTTP